MLTFPNEWYKIVTVVEKSKPQNEHTILNNESEVIKMRVIVKKVQDPYLCITEIEDELDVLQGIVGGLIECISIGNNIDMVCNEEGKLIGLEPHIMVNNDIVCGDVFFVGVDGAEFVSLTDEQIEYINQIMIR